MATSLNFDTLNVDGSGRASFSGLGSGIDIQGTVDAIIDAKRIPIDRIEQRISERDVQAAALKDLKSLSIGLRDTVEQLRGAVTFDASGDMFEAKQVFASSRRADSATPSAAADLLGVSVTNAADATSHEVEILQIARAHKIASDSLTGASGDALGEDGTFEINGASITVASGDSLLDVRDKINAANSGDAATGVSASIVSISDTERVLVLGADDTGTSAAMTLGDSTGAVLENLGVLDGAGAFKNELQAAQNAELQVDGLGTTVVRESNTVDDVFAGVTLSLFKAEAGTTVKLDVERDLNQVKSAIVDFVDSYNEVRRFINEQAQTEVPEDDETGAGVLAGTSALSDIRGRLSAAIGAAADADDPTFATLAQIGITIRPASEVADPLDANTLEIDETRLDDALLNQSDAVRELFTFDLSSSSADVRLVGFDRNTSYREGGYTLNVAYAGGEITSANLGGPADGSDNGTVSVDGNVLTVTSGEAKGLQVLYAGEAPASDVQLDVSVGIGAKLYHAADALVDETAGRIANEIDVLESQNELGQTRIERLETRLEREREHLLERFVAMETALTRMNRLLDSLRQQIDSAFGSDR